MAQLVVVFDNPPLETASWIPKVCASADLVLASNDAIVNEMAKSKEAQKVLLSAKQVPWGVYEPATPFYRAAFEKLYGDKPRVALYGINWLTYAANVAGFVLDLDGLEAEKKRGMRLGVKDAAASDYVKTYTKELTERARKHLPESKILILAAGEGEARMWDAATAFVQRLAS